MAVNIITGISTIIPENDAKEFNIPSIHTWDINPEGGMNPNNYEAYVKNIYEQSKDKDIWIFTYDPMLIEFFDVLSEYYEIECTFYLNDENGCLPCDDWHMSDIYDYLSKTYSIINRYKIRIRRGERFNNKNCCCCNMEE